MMMQPRAIKRAVAGKSAFASSPAARSAYGSIPRYRLILPYRVDAERTGFVVPARSRPVDGCRAVHHRIILSGGSLPLMLLLAACGGGGGGGGGGPVASASPASPPAAPPPAPERASAVSGSLYDGPIEGARVYVDVNRNRQVDSEDHLIDDSTDEEGNFEGEIPDRYKGLPLIADNRGADHHGSNVQLPAFFVAPAGSGVISPLTHIIEMNIVSQSVVRQHILFGRFLPLSENPHVIEDGASDRNDYIFYGHIRNFLEELTTKLKEAEVRGWSHDHLVGQVRALLQKYEIAIREAAESALRLTIGEIDNPTVEENTTLLDGETILAVTGWQGSSVPPVVEYRLAGGEGHEFVTVLPDGRIRLKQAPDHEAMQTISFTVEVRYFREGQGDDAGWHGRRDITIDVTDAIDEDV